MDQKQINQFLSEIDPVYLIQFGAVQLGWMIGLGPEKYTEGLILGTDNYFEQYIKPEMLDQIDLMVHESLQGLDINEELN